VVLHYACKSESSFLLYCFGAHKEEFHIIKFSYKNNIFSIFCHRHTQRARAQHNKKKNYENFFFHIIIMLQTYLIKIIFFFIISLLSFVCDMMPDQKKCLNFSLEIVQMITGQGNNKTAENP
jgi:hypothetical protein